MVAVAIKVLAVLGVLRVLWVLEFPVPSSQF